MIALPQYLFATDLLMVVCALLLAGCFGFGVGLAGFAGARRAAYRDFIIAHQRSVAVRAARIIEAVHTVPEASSTVPAGREPPPLAGVLR